VKTKTHLKTIQDRSGQTGNQPNMSKINPKYFWEWFLFG